MATRQARVKKVSPKAAITDETETTFKGRPDTWLVNRATLIQIFGVTTGRFPSLTDAGVAVRSEKKGYYLLIESMRRYGAFMSEEVLAPEDQVKYREKLNSTQERARLMRAQREKIEITTRQLAEQGMSIDALDDFLMTVALTYVKSLEDIPARLVMVQGATGRDAARIKKLCETECDQIRRLVLSRFDAVSGGIIEKIDALSREAEEIDA